MWKLNWHRQAIPAQVHFDGAGKTCLILFVQAGHWQLGIDDTFRGGMRIIAEAGSSKHLPGSRCSPKLNILCSPRVRSRATR